MRDLRRPRPNMGDQKSPKLPLDLTLCVYYTCTYMLVPPIKIVFLHLCKYQSLISTSKALLSNNNLTMNDSQGTMYIYVP